MPFPLVPVLGALGGLASGLFSSNATKEANEQNLAYMRETRDLQRSWALSDWNMNNAYNSPAAQMQRFKDANLNPNLIYGQQATAAPVRSSGGGDNPGIKPVDYGSIINSMLSGFLSMYDLQKTQAETDKVKEQAKLIEAQTRLNNSGAANKDFDLFKKTSAFDYDMAALALRNKQTAANIEKTNAGISKINADTQFTIDENARQAAMQEHNLAQAVEKTIQLRFQNSTNGIEKALLQQRLDNLKKDGTLKDLTIALNQQGITWSDPWYLRIVSGAASGKFDNFGKLPAAQQKKQIETLTNGFNKPSNTWQDKIANPWKYKKN